MGRRWWAGPARPGPLIFYMMGRGPTRPVKFSEDGLRPGPAHHFLKRFGPARPGPSHGSEAHETRAIYGPARQLCGPARGFPWAGSCVVPYQNVHVHTTLT